MKAEPEPHCWLAAVVLERSLAALAGVGDGVDETRFVRASKRDTLGFEFESGSAHRTNSPT
jgi:hypothetical protein